MMDEFNNYDKTSLKKDIMALNFAINDLVLYLDTHPNDSRAINLHSQYSERLEKLKNKYEEMYGPLTVIFSSPENSNRWAWSEEPWPWERGNN